MQSCGLLALCEAELQTEEVDLDRAYPDSKALCEKESEEKKKKEKHVNNTTFQNGRLRRTTTLLGEQITSANTILLGSSELQTHVHVLYYGAGSKDANNCDAGTDLHQKRGRAFFGGLAFFDAAVTQARRCDAAALRRTAQRGQRGGASQGRTHSSMHAQRG